MEGGEVKILPNINPNLQDNNNKSGNGGGGGCNCACNAQFATNLLLQLQTNLITIQSQLSQLQHKVIQLESNDIEFSAVATKVHQLEAVLNNVLISQQQQQPHHMSNNQDEEQQQCWINNMDSNHLQPEIIIGDDEELGRGRDEPPQIPYLSQPTTNDVNNYNELSIIQDEDDYEPPSPSHQIHSFQDKFGSIRLCNFNPSLGLYICPGSGCTNRRSRKGDLKQHFDKTHLDPSLHKCSYCQQVIKLVDDNTLHVHVESCHEHDETCLHSLPPAKVTTAPPPRLIAKYKCKCCPPGRRSGAGFVTQSELATHYTMNHRRILGKPTGILRLGVGEGEVDEIVIDDSD